MHSLAKSIENKLKKIKDLQDAGRSIKSLKEFLFNFQYLFNKTTRRTLWKQGCGYCGENFCIIEFQDTFVNLHSALPVQKVPQTPAS